MEGSNLQLMSQVYLKIVDTDGPNKQRATEMEQTNWTEASEDDRADAAHWLLDHIGDSKGKFAQLLAQELRKNDTASFGVPGYIEQAVLWAIGINQSEQAREEEAATTS